MSSEAPHTTNRWNGLRGWYLQKVVATLLRSMSYEAATRFAMALARGVFDQHPPVRHTIESNLRTAGFAPTPETAARLARQVFEQTARFWTELLYLPRRVRPNSISKHIEWHEPECWQAVLTSRRPLILVTPYLGNPVIGTLALSQRCAGLTVGMDAVSRGVTEALWPRVIRGNRLSAGKSRLRIAVLPRDSGMLGESLRQNGRLCLFLGPRPGVHGLSAMFLGQPCRFPATIIRLARRHGASIVTWTCKRGLTVADPFQMALAGEIEPAGRMASQVLRDLLGRIATRIGQTSEQYLWTRPAGPPSSPPVSFETELSLRGIFSGQAAFSPVSRAGFA